MSPAATEVLNLLFVLGVLLGGVARLGCCVVGAHSLGSARLRLL